MNQVENWVISGSSHFTFQFDLSSNHEYIDQFKFGSIWLVLIWINLGQFEFRSLTFDLFGQTIDQV